MSTRRAKEARDTRQAVIIRALNEQIMFDELTTAMGLRDRDIMAIIEGHPIDNHEVDEARAEAIKAKIESSDLETCRRWPELKKLRDQITAINKQRNRSRIAHKGDEWWGTDSTQEEFDSLMNEWNSFRI